MLNFILISGAFSQQLTGSQAVRQGGDVVWYVFLSNSSSKWKLFYLFLLLLFFFDFQAKKNKWNETALSKSVATFCQLSKINFNIRSQFLVSERYEIFISRGQNTNRIWKKNFEFIKKRRIFFSIFIYEKYGKFPIMAW